MSEENQVIEEQVPQDTPAETFFDRIAKENTRLMEELAPRENYTLDVNGKPVTFNRVKIRTAQRTQLEVLRQKLADSLQDNRKAYPQLEDQLYKKMASYYLINSSTGKPMTPEEYDGIFFEDIKPILNACAFRTERPIPAPAPLGK